MTMQLHLQQVPAANGRLWIRHGFRVFRRQPMAFVGLMGLALLASMLLTALPLVGPLLGLMAIPICSLGFMLATHLVLQKKMPTAAVFVAPLRLTPERRNRQLVLGASFAVLALLILMAANAIDGEATRAVMELMEKKGSAEEFAKVAEDSRIVWGALLRFGGLALLSVPYWHAPALIHWGGQGVGQALFSSTLALWRNKAAFALNGLLWVAAFLVLSMAITMVFTALGLLQAAPVVMLVVGMLAWAVFYASLYFSFVDCFMFGAPQDLLDSKT
ncbi:BPSS1780 family membrane protein [Roseateles sp. DXS20W]|uniref:BPSS1780 family membrane protein n=1 Tax=Pelomonas lactea TaxID=3299030 RepID=A0ABW7GJ13_9BURK